MQVVRLSDSLVRGDRSASGRSLHARSFGMTPLGPRLGLVQWVENTVPIFQVRPRVFKALTLIPIEYMGRATGDFFDRYRQHHCCSSRRTRAVFREGA